jgi:hypothetical protein
MSKTPKNHPQMMAHHNLFNNTTYGIRLRNNTTITISNINEDYDTLTPSLRVSGRGINLALAPQTPNFYLICVGSSKSLRHLYAVHDYFNHAGGRDIFFLDWRQVLTFRF